VLPQPHAAGGGPEAGLGQCLRQGGAGDVGAVGAFDGQGRVADPGPQALLRAITPRST
jgi:hypothetical protein